MSIPDKFGKALYEKRRALGWSIEQMAGYCELSARHYGNLEKGKSCPLLETAVRIARKLDISLDNL